MDKLFAIAILNWNGKELLQKFLPSIILYSPNTNIYVIDNASTDDSVLFLQENFPQVTIIQNNENYGFAKGYNKGLKNIKEPYLALVNSDVEVTKNWLNPIQNIFDNEPETAVIQPKILDYNRPTHFEYAGAAGGFIDKYGFSFCRGRIFGTIEEDQYQYEDIIDIFWASGACFFIRNDVYKKLEGFDEDFFAHQEEIDLCWRIQNTGKKVKYCAFSVIYHVGGATLQYHNPWKTYLNFRNSLLMMHKNLPDKKRFQIIFIRLCLDGIAGFRFILMLKPKHCLAIIRSHLAYYKRITKIKLKKYPSKTNHYFKVKSIVIAYFVKRKKEYNHLLFNLKNYN